MGERVSIRGLYRLMSRFDTLVSAAGSAQDMERYRQLRDSRSAAWKAAERETGDAMAEALKAVIESPGRWSAYRRATNRWLSVLVALRG